MFCPKCGSENLDTSRFCKKCGKNLPNRSQIQQAVTQSYQMPQASNLIGQALDGKYRIEARIGAGGMGDVYRATRLLIGDTVAIKILHAHLARDAQAAERFRREAVTATKLRHRNVVALYDVGISAAHNVPYILMELAEGLTLRQIVNHQPVLPLDFAVTVVAQVCAALEEAHRLGIVHRDIKPENIIANQTTTGWHVKVLDFGIAKLYNQMDNGLTLDGSAMGTPQYMSPEQCLGEPLDARSDIYSVGIVLYEMLCGSVPFKSAAASAVAIYQVQTAPPPPSALNPNITPHVESVILRALAKQREMRQQTAQGLAQELIQAATAAFKAGNSSISNIAAPVDIQKSSASESAANFGEPQPNEENQTSSHTLSDEFLVEKESEAATDVEIPKPVDEISPMRAETVPMLGELISGAKEKPSVEGVFAEERAAATNPAEEKTVNYAPGEKALKYNALENVSDALEPLEISPTAAKTVLLPENKSASDEDFAEREILEGGNEKTVEIKQDLTLVFQDAEALLDELFPSDEKKANFQKSAAPESEKKAQDFESARPVMMPTELLPESGGSASPPDKQFAETQTESGSANYGDYFASPASGEKFDENQPHGAASSDFQPQPENLLQVKPPSDYAKLPIFIFAAFFIILFMGGIIGLSYWFLSGESEIVSTGNKTENIKKTEDTKTTGNNPPEGMAYVPGGEFLMGSDTGDEYSRPAHKVSVKPFFIDLTEVTNEDYKKFVDAANYKMPTTWINGTFPDGKAKIPVTGVNWDDANAYAKWAGKRLPTEEEWEFAARGTDNRIYPWGNDWGEKLGNADANAKGHQGLANVGEHPGKSPFGLLDMSGNAWEWTASEAKPYPNGKSFPIRTVEPKIIRGGFWGSNRKEATAIFRGAWGARIENDYNDTGFRCVKDIQ